MMFPRLQSTIFPAFFPKKTEVYTPEEHLMLREQSMELLMEYVFDIPMLYGIVSNSTAVRALFEATPKRYLRLAMQNFFGEINHTIAAMLAAYSLQPNNAVVMDPFLDKYLDGYGPDLMSLDQIPKSYEALQKLYITYIAVETFTPLFVESRVHNLYLPDDGWKLRYTASSSDPWDPWDLEFNHQISNSKRWHAE